MKNVDFDSSRDVVIEQTAQMMFDNIGSSDIVLAVLGRDGSCTSSRPEVFAKVFANQGLLRDLCSKIDDGCEHLISRIDDCLIIGSSLLSGVNPIGYVIMLLPGYSPEKSFEYLDFIEIIMEQFSLLAGVVEQNQHLAGLSRAAQADSFVGVLAGVN
ncbi:MAG: hypothetical protein WC765_06975 [Phycisphaerae bacterium]|jgi:hypothetical protein